MSFFPPCLLRIHLCNSLNFVLLYYRRILDAVSYICSLSFPKGFKAWVVGMLREGGRKEMEGNDEGIYLGRLHLSSLLASISSMQRNVDQGIRLTGSEIKKVANYLVRASGGRDRSAVKGWVLIDAVEGRRESRCRCAENAAKAEIYLKMREIQVRGKAVRIDFDRIAGCVVHFRPLSIFSSRICSPSSLLDRCKDDGNI